MGTQAEDPRKPGKQQTARVGQPDEGDRTSQENAGSTQGGGTRNPGSLAENTADKTANKTSSDASKSRS